MSSSIINLPKLSRNKSTGNFITLVSIFLFLLCITKIYKASSVSNIDSIFIFGLSAILILFILLVNKFLRKPFFSAISKYFGELNDRKLNTQQVSVKIDLIEPLQPLIYIKPVLKEINDIKDEINVIIAKTSQEISIRSHPINTPKVQHELRLISRLAQESLEEIEKKETNILLLARARKVIFNTINKQINTPRNEIESDYILFKVQKQLKDQIFDDILLERIINHAIQQGEINGKLNINEIGELVFTIYNIPENEIIEDISWGDSTTDNTQYCCVICRHAIENSEPISVCPICQNVFHRTHLLEWLKVFNQCPLCHNRITLFSNQ